MSGMHSRRKGANGELEAAVVLSDLFGFAWRRTAQRWGKGKPDVEPVGEDAPLHVEVKRYVGGLAYWTRRVEANPLNLFIGKADHDEQPLYFCDIRHIRGHLDQESMPEEAPRQACVARWMKQAIRDCEDGLLPVVMCRQDHGPWMLAWRQCDDDRLMLVLRRLLLARGLTD